MLRKSFIMYVNPDCHEEYELDPSQSFAFAHVGGRYADVAMHSDDIESRYGNTFRLGDFRVVR